MELYTSISYHADKPDTVTYVVILQRQLTYQKLSIQRMFYNSNAQQ